MLYEFIEYEQRLANAELLTLRDVDGVVIEVQRGGVWLTEEGGDDVYLTPGQPYRTRGSGTLLIEALDASQLRIHDVETPSLLRSLRQAIAALRHHGQPAVTAPRDWSQAGRNTPTASAQCSCA